MAHIRIVDIIGSLTVADRTLQHLRGIDLRHSPYGYGAQITGRNAVVCSVNWNGVHYAMKCYLREWSRGEAVCNLISSSPSHAIPDITYLPSELFVATDPQKPALLDVVLYPWQKGYTLDFEIARCAHNDDRERLALIARNFVTLATEILDGPWRHGDLKPVNIMVSPQGTLSLIDLDALYAPELPPSNEAGTYGFVHPARGEAYDSHIDDYPMALICVVLHALIANPSLREHYPTSNNLLMMPDELVGQSSDALPEVMKAVADNAALVELCHALTNKESYKIDNLKEILQHV